MRHAAKRDMVEPQIVKDLRRCGYKVWLLDDWDALVCGPGGRLHMLEFKSPGGTLTDIQKRIVADGWPLHFVKTTEEALSIVGSREPSVDNLRRAGL